jgi:hypothetical protein
MSGEGEALGQLAFDVGQFFGFRQVAEHDRREHPCPGRLGHP